MDDPFHEPGTLMDEDLQLVLVESRNGPHPFVPQYRFEMRCFPTGKKAGVIDLRTALTPRLAEYGGHLGYSVDSQYRGAGFAARSCRLLFPLARTHNINPILVTCSPDNLPSVKTCESIGGELVKQQTIKIDDGTWRKTNYYHVHL